MRRLAWLSILLASSVLAAENDLSVGWIARLPRIDYVWNSSNPAVEGWPAAGSAVTWVANVRWLGAEPLHGVTYRWTIDGQEVRRGTLDFAPESLAQAELPWTWTFTRHEIAFEIDPDRNVAETEKRNNKIVTYSNALAVGIYVERTFRDTIGPRLKAAGIGATTFEDWMQIQARRFNEMAVNAVYPGSPDGVIDRWRIDDIHVVDDNALPLVPPYTEARDWGATGLGSLYPNVLDHTVDMQWGFPTSSLAGWNPPLAAAWIFTIGNSIVHEWCHAHAMVDTYAWNLTPSGDIMKLNPAPPLVLNGNAYYQTPETGLMNLNWGNIDAYTAAAMNRMTGWRARQGNYNEPWDIGWFINDLPAQNRLQLRRLDGTAIANKKVTIHHADAEPVDPNSLQAYAMVFGKTPDTVMTTDGEGRISVGRNPFSAGDVITTDDRANGTIIMEIEDGSARRWAYIDSMQFNLAYWRGSTTEADYDVIAGAAPCFDQLGPSGPTPAPEALVTTQDVQFNISVTATDAYRLYYTVNGGAPASVEIPPVFGNNRTSVTLPLPNGRIVWWYVGVGTVAPPCNEWHSSIYAFDHQYQQTRRRAAR